MNRSKDGLHQLEGASLPQLLMRRLVTMNRRLILDETHQLDNETLPILFGLTQSMT
jgi:hypothetical protein